MKVKFEKEDRLYFTMAEAPIVNTIIKDMRSSEDTIEDGSVLTQYVITMVVLM